MKYNPYIFILLSMLLPIQAIADVQAMAGECESDEGCVSECPDLQSIPGVAYDHGLSIRTNKCKDEPGTKKHCECKKEVCRVENKRRKKLMCETCYYDALKSTHKPLAENKQFQNNLLNGCIDKRSSDINNELTACKAAASSIANECLVQLQRPKEDCDKEFDEAKKVCDQVAEANRKQVKAECTNAFVNGVPLTCRPAGIASTSGWGQWSTPE